MDDNAKPRDVVTEAVAAATAERRMLIPDPDTPAGRQEMLRRMRATKQVHYQMAIGCGPHAFIEINGLMAVYTDACARLEADGKPWVDANIHSMPIELLGHELAYLEEKLGCVLGRKLRIVFL